MKKWEQDTNRSGKLEEEATYGSELFKRSSHEAAAVSKDTEDADGKRTTQDL